MVVKKPKQFALCVRTDDCEDLELRKVYAVLSDKRAAKDGYLRIIDESGEDYLYPETYFVIVDLPERAKEALARTG
ncbi:MAG TPA: hypothetical protein VEK15_04775 [Vicinamibacteria bacterium]|nr:hypothetical protein [Vicinamibacteria bacterium]